MAFFCFSLLIWSPLDPNLWYTHILLSFVWLFLWLFWPGFCCMPCSLLWGVVRCIHAWVVALIYYKVVSRSGHRAKTYLDTFTYSNLYVLFYISSWIFDNITYLNQVFHSDEQWLARFANYFESYFSSDRRGVYTFHQMYRGFTLFIRWTGCLRFSSDI